MSFDRDTGCLMVSLLGLVFLVSPSWGQAGGAEPEGWSLRFGGTVVEPDGQFTDRTDERTLRTEADSAYGVSFSAEYRLSRRIGVEAGLMVFVEDDLSVRVDRFEGSDRISEVRTDRLGFQPHFVGFNLHLLPRRRADLYLGAFGAWVRYESFGLTVTSGGDEELDEVDVETLEIDDDWAYGLVLGLDIPFGEGKWFLHGSARYLKTTLESGGATADYDPFVATVGFGLRLGG